MGFGEACDPARGRFRAYRIDAGTDLFGDWLVDVTCGRIGSRGRTVRYVAASEAEARKIVRQCLQRRTTAPKRIGVGYQLRNLDDPARWMTALPTHVIQQRFDRQEEDCDKEDAAEQAIAQVASDGGTGGGTAEGK
jgi:hypothetical protein